MSHCRGPASLPHDAVNDGTNIRGLNTTATLWCSGAVGAPTRSGLFSRAFAPTLAILPGNTLLGLLVNWVNRSSMIAGVTEAEYRVQVFCQAAAVSDVRDRLDFELVRASYPIREVEILSESSDQIELAAILVPTTAHEAELDPLVAALERPPLVRSGPWTVETSL